MKRQYVGNEDGMESEYVKKRCIEENDIINNDMIEEFGWVTINYALKHLFDNYSISYIKENPILCKILCYQVSLAYACSDDNIEKINYLIKEGLVNINYVMLDGPPIQHAIINNAYNAVVTLLNNETLDLTACGHESTKETLIHDHVEQRIRDLFVGRI
jgi:hypothetical protein